MSGSIRRLVLGERVAGGCAGALDGGDVDAAASLVEKPGGAAQRQGRVTTLRRWFGWLEDLGGNEGCPMVAVMVSIISALIDRTWLRPWQRSVSLTASM